MPSALLSVLNSSSCLSPPFFPFVFSYLSPSSSTTFIISIFLTLTFRHLTAHFLKCSISHYLSFPNYLSFHHLNAIFFKCSVSPFIICLFLSLLPTLKCHRLMLRVS
eukprot:TRINITY_DN110418_c0_g1_i1.p1 TRINITY_DN110418_c0_g1~~TRINITY_DN110418_c0_g1_i1.p1  ORF type:complete len:107 (+),score=0.31 TRINITY_DN110418_c0_g1_i1:148-468(+)